MSRELLEYTRAVIAPVAVLMLGVPLLQHHSIEFLTAWKTGAPASWDAAMLLAPWNGWGWSFALEIISLWMWYERGAGRRLIAVVATAALLFGPIYLTISAEAGAWETMKGFAALAALERPHGEKNAARLAGELAVYIKNSEKRSGWLPIIEDTKAELRAAQGKLAELDRRILSVEGWPWALLVKAAGWITVIVLCGLGNVAAITSLSARFNRFNMGVSGDSTGAESPNLGAGDSESLPAETETPTPDELNHPVESADSTVFAAETPRQSDSPTALIHSAPPVSIETPETVETVESAADEVAIKRLQRMIEGKRIAAGQSRNEWADANKVNPRDLSFLMGHFSRLGKGLPTISANKLGELITRFLTDSEEATQ